MLGRQRPFSPGVPAEAGCLFTVAAGVHVFISGQSLQCFLVGWCTNKSYVIATSDLWLFIHASNPHPSTPHPHSPTFFFMIFFFMPFSTQLFFWPVLSFLTSCIICFVLALFFPGVGDMCQGDFTRNCKQALCRLNALGNAHTIVSPMEWSSLKGRGTYFTKTPHVCVTALPSGSLFLLVMFSSFVCSECFFLMMKCCLMSSDVSWHIRDKLRPMPKHGSM